MSGVSALMLLRLAVCEHCVEQHAHSERRTLIFFPLWITRLDRLGCLPEFDCFLSLLLVSTYLRRTRQNSRCLHTACVFSLQRQHYPGVRIWPIPSGTSSHWLIYKCMMSNKRGWKTWWKLNCNEHEFDWLNLALSQPNWLLKVFDSSTFRKAVAAAAANTPFRHLKRGIPMVYDKLLEGSLFHSLRFPPQHKNQKMKNGVCLMKIETFYFSSCFLMKGAIHEYYTWRSVYSLSWAIISLWIQIYYRKSFL